MVDAVGDGPLRGEQPPLCGLCGKEVQKDDLIKPGNGPEVYHKPCYNAKRSVDRCAGQLTEQEQQMIQKFKMADPEDRGCQ